MSSTSKGDVTDYPSTSTSNEEVPFAASRGRPRGRGRGRGRGQNVKGRGRGKRKATEEPGESLEKSEQVQKRLKTEIDQMSEEKLKETLKKAVTLDPGLMLEIIQPAERQSDQGYHPDPGPNSPEWCVCRNCRQMPTVLERKCCGKASCVSRLPNFDILILDEGVLALARMYRRDILTYNDEEDINKANRHQAYRQFVLWTHGRLASGDRRVIPSCCVWKIRDKFPDSFNQYTGFIPSRFG